MAACTTRGGELAMASCHADLAKSYKSTVFNCANHRGPQADGLIVERKGAIPPPE